MVDVLNSIDDNESAILSRGASKTENADVPPLPPILWKPLEGWVEHREKIQRGLCDDLQESTDATHRRSRAGLECSIGCLLLFPVASGRFLPATSMRCMVTTWSGFKLQ